MLLSDYLNELQSNTQLIVEMAESLENKSFKVPDGKWNPIQILEHIYLTERSVIALLSRPSDNVHNEAHIMGAAKLERAIVLRRDVKVDAPEAMHPIGTFNNYREITDAVKNLRSDLSLKLTDFEIKVDNRIHKHPRLGEMTIADWLYFILHHSRRHYEQIQDILAN